MRRTPDFLTTFNGYCTALSKPDDFVGDFLENRRILRVLHEKLHFLEIEDIIDDDEALDAFYVFNGARFIKDKVLNLFDDSEYSFPSMLGYLCDASRRDFVFPFCGDTEAENNELRRNFLLEYAGSVKINYFSEVVYFAWVNGVLNSGEQVSLYNYHSDEVSMDKHKRLEGAVQKVLPLEDSWMWYRASDNVHRMTRTSLWRFSRRGRLFKRNLACVEENMRAYSRLGTYNSNVMRYVMKLSACLNLPDDKHAEPEEKVLIDNWLELFDKFYPEYEKLKAWYVEHKEKSELGVLL